MKTSHTEKGISSTFSLQFCIIQKRAKKIKKE